MLRFFWVAVGFVQHRTPENPAAKSPHTKAQQAVGMRERNRSPQLKKENRSSIEQKEEKIKKNTETIFLLNYVVCLRHTK